MIPAGYKETILADTSSIIPQRGHQLKAFNVIPKEWDLVKIKNLVSLEYGKGLKDDDRDRGTYPVLGSAGIVGYHSQAIVDGPGIVIGRKGTAGRAIYVDSDFYPIDTTYYVKPRKKVDLKWLFEATTYLDLSRLSEGTVPGLNRNDAYMLYAPVPPLPEQHKIAEVLSTVDGAVEKTDAIIKETQELKRGLTQKLFTEGIGHTRFKETKIGRMPESWEAVKLGKVAKVQGGFAFKSEDFRDTGKYQVIRIGNLYGGALDLQRSPVFLDSIDEKQKPFLLKVDDLLTTMTGTVGKEDYGYVIKINNENNLLLNQRVCRFIPDDKKIITDYLFYTCITKKYLDQFYMMARGGTGNQTNIGTTDIVKILIALPPLPEQKEIASILSEVDTKLENEQATKAELERLKKGLSQVLLTGKVRVKV